jgi:hypothetical protein
MSTPRPFGNPVEEEDVDMEDVEMEDEDVEVEDENETESDEGDEMEDGEVEDDNSSPDRMEEISEMIDEIIAAAAARIAAGDTVRGGPNDPEDSRNELMGVSRSSENSSRHSSGSPASSNEEMADANRRDIVIENPNAQPLPVPEEPTVNDDDYDPHALYDLTHVPCAHRNEVLPRWNEAEGEDYTHSFRYTVLFALSNYEGQYNPDYNNPETEHRYGLLKDAVVRGNAFLADFLLRTIARTLCTSLGIALAIHVDPGANTLLHDAIRAGQVDIANRLIIHVRDQSWRLYRLWIDQENDQGQCALHLAALRGDYEALRMLRDFGADVTTEDNKGHDPQEAASALLLGLRANKEAVLARVQAVMDDPRSTDAQKQQARTGRTAYKRLMKKLNRVDRRLVVDFNTAIAFREQRQRDDGSSFDAYMSDPTLGVWPQGPV